MVSEPLKYKLFIITRTIEVSGNIPMIAYMMDMINQREHVHCVLFLLIEESSTLISRV